MWMVLAMGTLALVALVTMLVMHLSDKYGFEELPPKSK